VSAIVLAIYNYSIIIAPEREERYLSTEVYPTDIRVKTQEIKRRRQGERQKGVKSEQENKDSEI